ncbi:Transcription factor GTE4 isoform B [Glycine soja]|uniref:Transcription factor GTE4 isoform A n=1 Tax=Glycine soja TaxID=3848 RepID=A0A445HP08_GLYSO|nr:Transcription factor GTE4 isoform A [Glycine soja]RZB75516.1 Transcription factor GTE4 isoform B [Glycine soja]
MASEPMVGGDDEAREKQRFGERKVYTRRKVKKDPNAVASTTENNGTATSTVTNDNSVSNSTVQKSNTGEAAEAKSKGDNVSTQALAQPVVLPEDGNLAQPQVVSGLEDGNLGQPQLEDQNMVQTEVGSGLEDGNKAQPPGEDQNMAQTQEGSRLENENRAQPQGEDQNLAQTQVNSRLEDGDTAQLQLEDQNMVQSQSEDQNMVQPQSEDQNMVHPQSEDQNMAQPQSEDQNTAQPRLGDQNTAQLQGNSKLEDENMAQPQVSSRSEDANTAQPQVSSKLGGRKSPQPEVNSRLEDGNLPRPRVNSSLDGNTVQPLVVLVSDDSCSRQPDEPSNLNVQLQDDGPSSPIHQQEAVPSSRDLTLGNGVVEPQWRDRIKINLASKSKQQMRELRWKLERELGIVRCLVNRIEVKQRPVGGYGNSNVLIDSGINNVGGAKRAHSEVASAGVPREPASTRPLHQLSLSMLENSQGICETVEKEKRTPKANQFYRNSEFLLAKDKFPPAESNKKSKLNWKKQGGGEMGHGFGMGSKFFKSCSSLLEKLMKHKHGWVFNAPVDVEALGLHDYFTIITHPMDLGTVKSRLNKNWYKSPKEFAEDVRLTFRNAMTYNPPGQDVHIMAEQLSKIFEDRWAIIESDYNREMRYGFDYGAVAPALSPLSRRVSAFTPPPLDMRRILNRSESMTQTPRLMSITPSSRTPAPKKPKAKDPHKRDMTFEEKQKLSTNLQSLPSEKLDAIVQIIKKRNSALNQHDDEIEVDIDSVDAETLWELDRFVTNYKKSLSKNKRKAELAQARAEALQQNAIQKSQAPAMAEIPKETLTGELLRIRMKGIFPNPCLRKGEIKQIMGVGQAVQAAPAVILDLLQVILIVTVPQHLDLRQGRKGPECAPSALLPFHSEEECL